MARGRKGLGVEARAGCIRLRFTLATGEAVSETLKWEPTTANVKRAQKLAIAVRRDIEAGALDDERYREHFPDSARATKTTGARTFGDFCTLYLASITDKSANTRSQYRLAVLWWQKQLGADQPIKDIRHSRLKALWGSTPWASWKLANNYLIPLRGVFALALGDRVITVDPLEGLTNKRRAPGHEPDPFTVDEERGILNRLHTHHSLVATYFAFAFATGMRPEEIIELKWSDIDLRLGVARITRVRSMGEVRPPKNGKYRDVELGAAARIALKAQEPRTRMLTVEPGEDYVFRNPVTGSPWNSTASQRDHYWSPALRALGIRHRPAYNTRHTRATRMLTAGCKPAWCAAQLGHSVEMFLRVYAKWLPEAAERGSELAKVDGIPPDHLPEDVAEKGVANGISHLAGRRDWTRTT